MKKVQISGQLQILSLFLPFSDNKAPETEGILELWVLGLGIPCLICRNDSDCHSLEKQGNKTITDIGKAIGKSQQE